MCQQSPFPFSLSYSLSNQTETHFSAAGKKPPVTAIIQGRLGKLLLVMLRGLFNPLEDQRQANGVEKRDFKIRGWALQISKEDMGL